MLAKLNNSNSTLYNVYAEYAMLGYCNVDGNAEVLADLNEDDFYDPTIRKCVRVLKAIDLNKEPVNLSTFNEKSGQLFPKEKMELMDIFVSACADATISTESKYTKKIIKECAARRNGIALLKQCIEDLENGEIDYTSSFEKAIEGLRITNTDRYSWESIQDLMTKSFSHIAKVANGEYKPIKTQIRGIDDTIGGFYEGELTVIGARPGVGKSALAGAIAINAAKAGKKVCVCSREMSDIQYGNRIISNMGDVDGKKLRTGDIDDYSWEKIAKGINDASKLNINFMFTIANIEDLRAAVMKKHREGECDMLILDYLQLMRTKKRFDVDHLRVGYISKILKDLSLDLNIPVIALAQVRRSPTGMKKSRMPSLDELKDSGSIEQDADGVIFLHRPTSEDDDCLKNAKLRSIYEAGEKYGGKNQLIIANVAKQRQGETGMVGMMFTPGKMMFETIIMSD